MLTRVLILSALLSSCGADKGKDDAPKPTDATQPAGQEPSPSQDPKRALAIDDASQLPACTTEGEHWLIYVVADKAFLTCSAGQWVAIDVSTATEPSTKKTAIKAVSDAANRLIGVETSDGSVKIDGTEFSVKLSLDKGFSADDKFGRCFFFSADCSGECVMQDYTLPAFASGEKLYLPINQEGDHGIVSFADAPSKYFNSEYSDTSKCEAFDSTHFVVSANHKYPKGVVVEFILPFHFNAD